MRVHASRQERTRQSGQVTSRRHKRPSSEPEEDSFLHPSLAAVPALRHALAAPLQLSPAEIQALQGAVGNRAVQRLLGPAATGAPAVQRSVFLGDKRKSFTGRFPFSRFYSKHKTEGTRENVGDMLTDARKRYFKDTDELLAYANGNTDNIGYLAEEKTWIRLPNHLLVLGEEHSDTTLADIVNAVGTRRYTYEPYSELPRSLVGHSEVLESRQRERRQELAKEAGHKNGVDAQDHTAERLLPKIVVVLHGLRNLIQTSVKGQGQPPEKPAPLAEHLDPKRRRVYSKRQVQIGYLEMAMAVATGAVAHNPESSPKLWRRYEKLFRDSAAEMAKVTAGNLELRDTSLVNAIRVGTFTFEEFLGSFTEAAEAELKGADKRSDFAGFQTAFPDKQDVHPGLTFEQEGTRDYREWEAYKKAQRMREYYMMERIKAGQVERVKAVQGGGMLLVGMGALHLLHLEKQLAAAKIDAKYLKTVPDEASLKTSFTKEQRDRHPQ